MLALYTCDHWDMGLPPGHRFPAAKYAMLRQALAAEPRFAIFPAPLASEAELAAAHDPAYVRAFLEGALPAETMRRIGFPWSPALVTRTRASVGGTLAATAAALAEGFGGTLAGGTHHAAYGQGSGFCVFNDIAVAIRHFQSLGRFGRAAVIDLDVHQGDGTAEIFAGDPAVFTLSLHGRHNFPFRKQTSTLDIDFENNATDAAYLAALAEALPRVAAFGPEIVFYQAGVDALAEDTLGKLALTAGGLAARDHLVMTAARAWGVPFVLTLGGGYAQPIEHSVAASEATYRAALAYWDASLTPGP